MLITAEHTYLIILVLCSLSLSVMARSWGEYFAKVKASRDLAPMSAQTDFILCILVVALVIISEGPGTVLTDLRFYEVTSPIKWIAFLPGIVLVVSHLIYCKRQRRHASQSQA